MDQDRSHDDREGHDDRDDREDTATLDGPLDASTAEPPVFGESRHTVLSPSGQFESERDFARSLGARRMKIVVFGGGAVLMVFVLLAALQ